MANYFDLAKDAIKKLEKEVETCNPNTSLSIFISTKFLKDSIEMKEINHETYLNHMKITDDLATKFSRNCLCVNKQKIGPELRKVLTKYGHLKE